MTYDVTFLHVVSVLAERIVPHSGMVYSLRACVMGPAGEELFCCFCYMLTVSARKVRRRVGDKAAFTCYYYALSAVSSQ